MALSDFVQKPIRTLETGMMAVRVECALAVLAIAMLVVYYLY